MLTLLTLTTSMHSIASDALFVAQDGIDWNAAQAGCEALSTSLITLGGYNSEDAASCWDNFTPDELLQNPKIWIGAYYDDTNGWLWTEDNSPFLCPTQSVSECDAHLIMRTDDTHNAMVMAGDTGNVQSRSKTKTKKIVGYCCNEPKFCPTWNQIPGSFKHVSVATDGTVWSVDNAGTILRLESLDTNNVPVWTEFYGNWKMVEVGKSDKNGDASDNIIFAVADVDGSNLFRRLFSTPYRWHNEYLSPDGTGYTHVSAAADWTVWMIDTNKRVYARGNPVTEVPGQYLDYVSVGSSTQIWGVLLASGTIYERDTVANVWINHGNVDVTEDGTVFAITESDKIYYWNGNVWKRVCGSLKQVSVRSINEAWGVDANGNMFYFRN